jgi:hypothetical protein
MAITLTISPTSGVGMAGIPAVLWRVTEGKMLPLTIQLGARCRVCGCTPEVLFQLRDMDVKPEKLRCALCSSDEVRLLNAVALKKR